MDEVKFIYFSSLIKYSLTNYLSLVIIKMIEFYPIIMEFICSPIRIKNFFNQNDITYKLSIKNNKIIKNIYHLSLYYQFRKIRNSNEEYSYYILYIILGFILIYYFFLFFLKTQIDFYERKKETYVFHIINYLFVNFYDHFFFRNLSFFFHDVFINYLCKSNNYFVLSLIMVLYLIYLEINFEYYNKFRLCVKYDNQHKYIYEYKFFLYSDYYLFFVKIFISFELNNDNDNICFFFDILSLFTIILGSECYFKSFTFNIIGLCYGIFFNNCTILFILGILFVEKSTINTIIYIFFSLLLSFIISYSFWKNNFNNILRIPINQENHLLLNEQFELLCESYQTDYFNKVLNHFIFYNKISDSEQKLSFLKRANTSTLIDEETVLLGKNILNIEFEQKPKNEDLILILKTFNEKMKIEMNKNILQNEEEIFYYHLSKIFLIMMNDLKNNFMTIFEIKKIINKLKLINKVFYYNLRYFFQILCLKSSFSQNNNTLIYQKAFNQLFSSILLIIENEKKLLINYLSRNPKKYIDFSKLVSHNEDKIKNSYEILLKDPIKSEFQKIMFRIIFETLLNKVFSKSKEKILNNDIHFYEEILDRQYNNEKVLKLKINIKNNQSKIIKIGRDLNIYWNESFDDLLPTEFRENGLEKFYKNEQTNENKLFSQKFHYIVWNKDNDLKQFVYEYSIYPSLNEDIIYVDGIYKLGKDILIVTRKNHLNDIEKIFKISSSLEKTLFFNSNFLTLLNRYNINLELNGFVENFSTLMYDINHYCSYVYNKIKSLEKLCSPQELNYMKKIIDIFQKSNIIEGNKNNFFQFVYLFSIFDNEYENCFYSIKQYKNKKAIKIRKEKSIVNWNLKDDEIDNSSEKNKVIINTVFSSNAFDASVASQISVHPIANNSNFFSVKKKKMEIEHNHQNKKYYIIIFNILLIFIAIFCLIFENNLNRKLKEKFILYMDVFIFNRFILNLMTSYIALLNICDENLNCHNYIEEYFNQYEKFSQLDTFLYNELSIKMEEITNSFDSLNKRIKNSNEIKIKKYLETSRIEIYLSYMNDELKVNKLATQKIDYLFKTFINKIIMTTTYNISSIDTFRFIVDEEFYPIKIRLPKEIKELQEIELYVYEILMSHLDFSNFFYYLQMLIENDSKEQLQYNKIILNVFIFLLFIANILIIIGCIIFIYLFKISINNRIYKIDQFLSHQPIVELLIEKLDLLIELLRFYNKPPMINISELTKHLKNEEKKILNFKKEEKKDEIIKYSLFFLLKEFIIIIIGSMIIYFIYLIIFFIIANRSFNRLKQIKEIIQNASYSEELTYIIVSLIETSNVIDIPQIALYNSFWPILKNKNYSNESNFFSDLYNHHQECYLIERRNKRNAKFLPKDKDLLSMNCYTFYQQTNVSRFNLIIQNNPSINYTDELINYCLFIDFLKIFSQDNFLNNLDYLMLTLLPKNNSFDKKTFDEEVWELISETLIIYRPLRFYLGNYYFNNILLKKSNKHVQVLLICLLINIFIEIILFFIVKKKVLDRTIELNNCLNRFMKMINIL